uniref:DUF3707 domain-containing protein n=1 Tax=Panagrellus redivivus TaxID=6233 RepID=A0A7E4UX15_PANRE
MRLLYLAYFICSTVCFVDSSAPFAEKVPECFDGRAGSITVWYLSVDPYKFEIITTLSLDLIKTSIYLDVDNANPDLTFNEELMMLSCACTDLTLNSYEYFVSPVVFAENTVTGESTQTDALTLCVFHEASKSVAQVLDIPPFSFESFMIAKYIELMPRREIDLGESNSTGRCVNERGYIMSKFPGQNTCFYVYTVKINLNLMTIDNGKPRAEKAFKYGSFLASSDFPTVKELINIEAGAEDKWVTFSLC